MSEEDNEVAEVNPLEKMIDYITQSEFQKANDIFDQELGQRVSDTLDQEKVAIAQSMYSADEESEEYEIDDEDMEISDEDLEQAMADLEDEEV
jgi:hypothetical protein